MAIEVNVTSHTAFKTENNLRVIYRFIFQRMSESLERILCENAGILRSKFEG
jgi:hypothetical protein